jgi:hypothetical protein
VIPSFSTVQAYIDSQGGAVDMNEDLEVRDELSLEIVNEADADWVLITDAVAWCSRHQSKECSPIRNGCGYLDQQRQALQRRRAAADEGA